MSPGAWRENGGTFGHPKDEEVTAGVRPGRAEEKRAAPVAAQKAGKATPHGDECWGTPQGKQGEDDDLHILPDVSPS